MEAHTPIWKPEINTRKRPKAGVVVQLGTNVYAIKLVYREDSTVYYLYEGSSNGLFKFMSIDTAVRWLRNNFVRKISVDML